MPLFVGAAAPRQPPVTGSAAAEPRGFQGQAGQDEEQLEVYCWLQQQAPVGLMVRLVRLEALHGIVLVEHRRLQLPPRCLGRLDVVEVVVAAAAPPEQTMHLPARALVPHRCLSSVQTPAMKERCADNKGFAIRNDKSILNFLPTCRMVEASSTSGSI